jgi:hypothetical protein
MRFRACIANLYPGFIQEQEIEKELKQLDKERDAAQACG